MTPDTIRAAYEYLALTLPFSRWAMPDADDVKFEIIRMRDRAGDCVLMTDNSVRVRVSPRGVKGKATYLLETVAHEMCHLAEVKHKRNRKMAHGPIFRRMATQVCRHHGFDLAAFIGEV